MTDEEKEIQKKLGSYPKKKCTECYREVFEDELGPCNVCAACNLAHFACDYFFNPKFKHIREKVEDMRNRMDKVIEVLNTLVKVLDPIKMDDLNVSWTATDQEGLYAIEKQHDIVVKVEDGKLTFSVAALIATVTEILVDKRLAFQIDDDGYIVGFCWYMEKPKSD